MDTLPLELHELIVSFLLPHQDVLHPAALPVSTALERSDIYSTRLTCQPFRDAASSTFIRIVQDVPTSCREEGLRNLNALLDLPDVSRKLTCLTLRTSRLFIKPDEVQTRCGATKRVKWANCYLEKELLSILKKLPQLCHVRCVLQAAFDCFTGPAIRIAMRDSPDPMQVRRILPISQLRPHDPQDVPCQNQGRWNIFTTSPNSPNLML